MKLFFTKLLIFLLPILFIYIIGERELYYFPNSVNSKKQLLLSAAPDIEVLALGSSHAAANIYPKEFSYQAVNLGSISQSLYYDDRLLTKYLNNLPKLKLVIITLSYLSLEYDLSNSDEYWREFLYECYHNIPLNNPAFNYDLKRYSLFALYGKDASIEYLIEDFNHTILGKPLEEEQYVKLPPRVRIDDAKDRISVHNRLMDPMFINQNKEYIMHMIQSLRSKNIDVIMLTPPVYPTYAEVMDKSKYELMQKNINEISKTQNVPYFNYFFDKRMTAEDYGDPDHLNVDGGKKFSQIINREILIPRLKK